MTFVMRSLLAVSFAVLSANATFAQDDTSCPENPTETATLAKVQGTKRAYFQSDKNGCPWTGGKCNSSSYVIPGNTVIVSKIREGYVCAYYTGSSGYSGWLPASQVEEMPVNSNPPLSAWLGKWSPAEDVAAVTISEHKGELMVKGQAWWPDREGIPEYPNPNEGVMDGKLSRIGNIAKWADPPCEVTFTLLEPFLIVNDNEFIIRAAGQGSCWGANVDFTGVYPRAND